MFDRDLLDRAEALLAACRRQSLRLATAESCTGGLIAACLTAIPGSSDVFDCGFVTYSNTAKTALLDVPAALLARQGAVSADVVQAMAQGALAHARADLAVAVTGIAGPGGGSPAKPVGTVHFATMRRGGVPESRLCRFEGDRDAVRRATILQALDLLSESVAIASA